MAEEFLCPKLSNYVRIDAILPYEPFIFQYPQSGFLTAKLLVFNTKSVWRHLWLLCSNTPDIQLIQPSTQAQAHPEFASAAGESRAGGIALRGKKSHLLLVCPAGRELSCVCGS